MPRISRRMKSVSTFIVLFAVAVLASAVRAEGPAGGPSFGGQERGASSLAFQGLLGRAADVKERHADRLMANPGVVGAGVGVMQSGTPGVVVLTRHPGVAGIPADLEGVPVEVVVTGEISAIPAHEEEGPDSAAKAVARIDRTQRFPRPVPIGVSSGNGYECSAGTIGARVRDASGAVYALSNNHVYARENHAAAGEPVVQPGLYDTRCVFNPNDVIGTLSRSEWIDFSAVASNTMDAAIAASTPGDLGNATPIDGYGIPSTVPVGPALNFAVMKYGRTSALTEGTINLVNTSLLVGYSSGTARFVNQIGVVAKKGAFIKPGDSGSLLVTSVGRNPVGLLFAGNSNGRYAFANPIEAVLSAFGVVVDASQ